MEAPEFNIESRTRMTTSIFSILLAAHLLGIIDYFGNLDSLEIKVLTYAVVVTILYLSCYELFHNHFVSFLNESNKPKDLNTLNPIP